MIAVWWNVLWSLIFVDEIQLHAEHVGQSKIKNFLSNLKAQTNPWDDVRALEPCDKRFERICEMCTTPAAGETCRHPASSHNDRLPDCDEAGLLLPDCDATHQWTKNKTGQERNPCQIFIMWSSETFAFKLLAPAKETPWTTSTTLNNNHSLAATLSSTVRSWHNSMIYDDNMHESSREVESFTYCKICEGKWFCQRSPKHYHQYHKTLKWLLACSCQIYYTLCHLSGLAWSKFHLVNCPFALLFRPTSDHCAAPIQGDGAHHHGTTLARAPELPHRVQERVLTTSVQAKSEGLQPTRSQTCPWSKGSQWAQPSEIRTPHLSGK